MVDRSCCMKPMFAPEIHSYIGDRSKNIIQKIKEYRELAKMEAPWYKLAAIIIGDKPKIELFFRWFLKYRWVDLEEKFFKEWDEIEEDAQLKYRNALSSYEEECKTAMKHQAVFASQLFPTLYAFSKRLYVQQNFTKVLVDDTSLSNLFEWKSLDET